MASILRNEKLLRSTMDSSESIKECLLKLGLRAAGGNYSALLKACKEFNIPVKRSDGRLKTRIAIGCITIPLDKILVKNSTYTARHALKKRLIKANILEEKCANCGLGNEWQGKPLSLQLEHINGVFNDHRLENICLLCPNCHSQTDTFAGKRNKKITK